MARKQEEAEDQVTFLYILVMSVVYVGYLFLGAVIFMVIEQRTQGVSRFVMGVEDDNEAVKRVKEHFLRNHSSVSESELEELIEAIYTAAQSNIDPRGNTTPSYNWNGFNGVLFTTSIVTTIGFGNITPQTPLGQIMCILYAVVGIPLNFTLLGHVGGRVQQSYAKIAEKLSRNRRIRNRLRCAVGIILGAILSIFLPAIFYCWFEGWTYLQSVYFCFITISTIGFGDFYPSSDTPKRGTAYYFLFLSSVVWGMVWLSAAFNIVQSTKCPFRNCSSRLESKVQERKGVPSVEESIALQEDCLPAATVASELNYLPAHPNKDALQSLETASGS